MREFDGVSSSGVIKNVKKGKKPQLPEAYGTDRIVLLPVNPSLCFVYWEIASFTLNGEDVRIRLVNRKAEIRFEFPVKSKIGDYYVNAYLADEILCAVMGLESAEGFVEIMRSNSILVPRDYPVEVPEDSRLWMDFSGSLEGAGDLSSMVIMRNGFARGAFDKRLAEDRDE